MLDFLKNKGKDEQDQKGENESVWVRFKHRCSVISRYCRKRLARFYRRASIFLGFKAQEPQEEQKADITEYLAQTKQEINSLPNNYLHHFDKGSQLSAENFEGIEEHIHDMEDIQEQRKQGMPSAASIVGEKGSGRSGCIELLCDEVFEKSEIWNIKAEQRSCTEKELLVLFEEDRTDPSFSSAEELVVYLNKNHAGEIILLEDIQQLYLRHLDGYEAFEKLIYIITETREHVFWIVSCTRYAWNYLNKAFSFGNYFSSVLATDQLSDDQVESLIMHRHSSGDYDHVFASSKKEAQELLDEPFSDDYKKEQQKLRHSYFKDLAGLAEGNASIAIIFWLKSIHMLDENAFFIAPLDTSSFNIFEDSDPEMLFVLAALVLHPAIKTDQLALTQQIGAEESYMLLNRFKTSGVLTHSSRGYSINHLLYRQVIKELKDRNILHF